MLCAGFIIAAICVGISLFSIRTAGKRSDAKGEATEQTAAASEPAAEPLELANETSELVTEPSEPTDGILGRLRETEADENKENDRIVETEQETKGAVQDEVETATAAGMSDQEETPEAVGAAGTNVSEVAVEAGKITTIEARADKDPAERDNGMQPGTTLPADQLNFDELSRYFTSAPIEAGDAVYGRINGKSWQENDYISLSDLRYLKVLHYNFSGQIQVGELIVNKSIAEDVLSIFEELFSCGYQIQSMYLIDNYWTGDPDDSDTASIDANNTSAFCYRPITNGTKLSNHAYGLAIDINPQQNPYVSYSGGSPKWYHENANDYIARDTGLPHVITHGDAAFLIFQKYGFTWGGDWNNPKDYQHFERR